MELLCRLCGDNPGTTNIFSSIAGSKLSDILMYFCVNIKIMESDRLPKLICSICERESKSAYQFVLKCEDSDKKLRSNSNVDRESELKDEKYGTDDEEIQIKDEPSDSPSHYKDEFSEDTSIQDLIPLQIDKGYKEKPISNKCFNKHTKESNPCQDCEGTFRDKSKLNAHQKCHAEKKLHRCDSCDKAYTYRGSLKKHQLLQHFPKLRQKNYVCEACGKAFYTKSSIEIHMRTHTGEAPHACSICHKKFKQISSLKRHELHHSQLKLHSCSECGKRFKTRDCLKMHLQVHTTDKNFTCPVCKSQFKFKNSLRSHLVLHTGNKGFVCDHCGRAYYTKGNLKLHIDKQHSEKSGKCSACNKLVPNLEEHMKKHSGEKSLKCHLCDSSFVTLNGLSHHINFRHNNTNRFKCSYEGCIKTFPSRPMLDFHEAKTHGTTVPHPCAKCARGFYRKNDLARHMIGTHKERLKD